MQRKEFIQNKKIKIIALIVIYFIMGFIYPHIINLIYSEEALNPSFDVFTLFLWPIIYFFASGFSGDILLLLLTLLHIAIFIVISIFIIKKINSFLNSKNK